jgi:N-acetylglucosaminyldiphosphoundecaprenol N-acetyl-beta-D-mannosaminyltransferase
MALKNSSIPTVSILRVNVHVLTKKIFLERINSIFQSSSKTIYPVYSINPEIIMQAQENDLFRYVLNHSFVSLADGIGIMWASKMLKEPLQSRITGVSIVKALIEFAGTHELTIGIIGGKPNAAITLAKLITDNRLPTTVWADRGPELTLQITDNRLPTTHYQQLTLPVDPSRVFTKDSVINLKNWLNQKPSYSTLNTQSIQSQLIQTSILIVGFGAPKQEFFIASLPYLLNPSLFRNPKGIRNLFNQPLIAVAAGGSIDELSGYSLKPPKWIEDFGLKWLFRLITEPKRLKRQLKLISFLKNLLKEINRIN